MNGRERVKTILNFGIPDRIGIFDAPWPETIARWHKEGLPQETSPHEYFGFDVDYCIYLNTSFMLQEEVLKENKEFVVFRNDCGTIEKYWRKKTGVPFVLDYPVKNDNDWLKYKPLLKPALERISLRRWGDYALPEERIFRKKIISWEDTFNKYKDVRDRNRFIFFCVPGPFETINRFIRTEELYLMLIQSTQLLQDMFFTITELIIKSFHLLKEKNMEVDGIFFSDDIAYKNAMLFSPKIYYQLFLPCYQEICTFFKREGLTLSFHTDGNLNEALPLLLEAGITAIQPLEAKAGNDVGELKSKYGDNLVFIGNIDVTKMDGNKKIIEEEIKNKILPAKENGGYIFHSDHSVPPSVSFDNYKYIMELVKQHGQY